MEKPISVVRQEFIDDVVGLVNESILPMFVIEPILKELYISVKKEAERVYQKEKAEYEKSLKITEKKEVD